jgi:protein-disulfide isomerase
MSENWKIAALGALGGATISLVIVFGAAALGAFQDKATTERVVHDYLLSKPELVVEAQQAAADNARQAEVDATQHAVDKLGSKAYLDPRVAFTTGPVNAKTTVVEFFDYNCPYCRLSLPAVQKYYDKNKDKVRFAFIEFPIKGDESVLATRALLAARHQPDKYVPFHFALMGEQDIPIAPEEIDRVARRLGLDVDKLHTDMQDPALAKAIASVHLLARRSKINGTPTFIVNGNVRPGAVDDELLADLLKRPRRG